MKLSGQQQKILEAYEKLKSENEYLKQVIENNLPGFKVKENTEFVVNTSDAHEKVRLFRDVFRGRTDVFARRWESKSGRSGYAPACLDHNYLALSDQAIYDHLSGKHIIGLYPMLVDGSCWLLVVDFDKNDWQEDVLAFTYTCRNVRIPFSIERSRSGNGAHVWIFFSEALPAALVRTLGKSLIEQTRSRKPNSLDSFDRFFPSQDHLATPDSLGNLIALPLQPHARNHNNSVFITESFQPFEDQWAYLSSIIKINEEVKRVLHELAPTNHIYMNNKQPTHITAIKKNGIYFDFRELSEQMATKLKELASFSNPDFYKLKAKRLSTRDIPSRIECFDQNKTHLILPRGCEDAIQEFMVSHKIKLELIDERFDGSPIDADFHGNLSPQQQDALQQLLANERGVLAAATGFGKTVTAAALIAKQKVNTLIIVNRKQLLNQWIDQLSIFLNIPRRAIGQIGGGKQTATGKIDVAMIQTLYSKGIDPVITQYGQVIVDECHHLSAYTSEQIMKMIRAKFVYGLTATPARKDGLHPIVQMQCGPILYKTDAKKQALIRPFHHFLRERVTNYQTKSESIQQMYNEIAEDTKRNQLIFDDVLLALEQGMTPMILTERVNHVIILENLFKGFAKNIVVLSGELKKKEQEQALKTIKELTDTEELLIIATGKYIGEGFDFPRLDALFLAMPISWKGLLTQYVGRLHRIHSDKQEVHVYDYIDRKVPILLNMSKKRLKGFREMGYVNFDDDGNTAEQMRLF